MRMKLNGNKAETMVGSVVNQDTVVIPAGSPLVQNFSGTWDGAGVVLPSTAGSTKTATFLEGIAINSIPVNQHGEAFLYGLTSALIVVATRANTGANWTSANIASGTSLVIDPVNNGFTTGATIAAGVKPYCVLVDPVTATPATPAGGDTRLVILASYRVYCHFV